MRPCLISVDLQRAFLEDRRLEPPAGQVLAGARAWQERFRREGHPVVHVRTTVSPPELPALPHWDEHRIAQFTRGADGWAFAPGAEPADGEPVVEKSHYSPFGAGRIEALLRSAGVDQLVLAGVHLHGCVRSTALDASAAGFQVAIAADAIASNDPPHASATRRWMSRRAFRFANLEAWEPSPGRPTRRAPVPVTAPAAPSRAREWAARPWEERAATLRPLAPHLRQEAAALGETMAGEIHKPLAEGRDEVEYAARVAELCLARGEPASERTSEGLARRVPHGTVLLITPWNNPLAIAVGKLVPALAHGNTVLWKPSPHCPRASGALEDIVGRLELPDGAFRRLGEDGQEAEALIAGGGVDAVSVTGSLAAGRSLHDLCAPRLIPLQAELGGNNAVVVGRDADADASADALVAGAFSFAGQRCTAVRRAILIGGAYEPVIEATKRRVEALRPGDPRSDRTTLPPVRARSEAERIDALLERARADGAEVWRPGWAHDAAFSELRSGLPFVAPAVVESAAADSEIVQAESFGPVLVASRAADIRDAIERCNDVSQGLVASILSSAPQDVELFAAEARAGVLKLNGALAGAAPSLPFGGVGTSGAGPPEHGAGDADFYSRWQAVLA